MKDLIKRISIGVVFGVVIGYLIYLFSQGTVIVNSAFVEYNTSYYLLLGLICFFIFLFFSLRPVYFKMTKTTLFVMWIALIIIGDTTLVNDVTARVYIGDLFKLLGVVLTLLAWTNVLITDKVKKKKESKKQQVIEV